MRILLVQRYYWPDVPTIARFTKLLAERLAAVGHDVTVLTALPTYNQAYTAAPPPRRAREGGVRVIRLRVPPERKSSLVKRLLEMLPFFAGVAWHLLRSRGRYDAIYTVSTPPVLQTALVRRLARWVGAPYVYHQTDLHPEGEIIAGQLADDWKAGLLARMDARNCRRAGAVVVLSTDMRATLAGRGLDVANVHVINNLVPAPLDPAAARPPGLEPVPGTFRVLFAGNLGLFQGLDTVVEAAALLSDREDIHFVFMGSGLARDRLVAQAAPLGRTVHFADHQPLGAAMKVMSESAVGLTTLAPGVIRIAYPSKVPAYLEAGCRIVAMVEDDSELAAFVTGSGVGRVVAPGDAGALAAALAAERDRQAAHGPGRDHAREVARRHFGEKAVLDAWQAVFESLADG